MKHLLLILIVLLSQSNAKADWPVGKKRWLWIASFNQYSANKYFNTQGKITPFVGNNHFISRSLIVGATYGLSRYIDLVATAPIQNNAMYENNNVYATSGIGDCMVGLAYHFPISNFQKYLSLKALMILPGYTATAKAPLGYAATGFQLRANYSFSPKNKVFSAIEGRYTQYFMNDGPQQFGYSATLGTYVNNYIFLVGDINGTISNSINKNFNTNLNTNKDFDYLNAGATVGKRISTTLSVYLQLYTTLYGHSAGKGNGLSFSALLKLP